MKERLKEFRLFENLKLKDIGEKIGVTANAVGNWESG
jgi:transcriptional regulator with XRE-family HTH domain